jgi:hypothetical protein
MVGSAGGAIATADSDSGPSASNSQGADAPSTSTSPARGPIATIADSLRKAMQNSLQSTVQGVTGALTTLPKPGQVPFAIPKPPKTTLGGTPTVFGSTVPSTSPTDDASPAVPETEAQPASKASTVASPTGAPPDPIAAASNAVAPVTNALTAVATTVGSAPSVIASLPTSVTPVSDVLTYVQHVLTSVGDAGTSLTQLPTDLAGLLGVDTTVPTATIGAATGLSGLRAATAAPSTAPGWSGLPQIFATPGVEGAQAADAPPAVVTPLDITTTGVMRGESNAGSPLVTPKNDTSSDVLSMVEHVIGAFVATVSLTALAAMALPGIIGLLTTCAAGIRVGYRQAKAGSALPNTVISRFVGSGPVGVVRSSSQVELRSRASRFVGASAAKAAPARALRIVGSDSSTAELLDQAV